MAEKNVTVLKDLLVKAVKAMEGLEEGNDSKMARPVESSSNQCSSSTAHTKQKWSDYFQMCMARSARPRLRIARETSPAKSDVAVP